MKACLFLPPKFSLSLHFGLVVGLSCAVLGACRHACVNLSQSPTVLKVLQFQQWERNVSMKSVPPFLRQPLKSFCCVSRKAPGVQCPWLFPPPPQFYTYGAYAKGAKKNVYT